MPIHDPSGPPRSVEKGSVLADVLAGLLGGGMILTILAMIATPTMGATRSAKLKLRERKQQTEEAAQRAQQHDAHGVVEHSRE